MVSRKKVRIGKRRQGKIGVGKTEDGSQRGKREEREEGT